MLAYLKEILASMRWQDLMDILLITFILYRLYVWLQGTRALRILIALAALGLLYLLARWSGLFITTWILQYLWAVILVIMVVVFQSEIRQVLERMSPLNFFLGQPETLDRLALEEVVRTAFELAKNRIGALIVFQRRDILEDHLKGGIPLDGRISFEVLSSIFIPSSPAHDGAVIIHGGRIVSVGCYLPLSDNPALPRNYGSRHRAGIGITEKCDAISLIVSEERGEVLLAVEGEITRMGNPGDLQERLGSMLFKVERKKNRWPSALTANLVPKGIAFALVLVLWGFIAGQQRTEMWLTVPLEYRNIPTNMEIAGELVNKVEVGIRGPRGVISGVSQDQVRAHIDLSQGLRGLNYVRITTDNIRIPVGTEVTKINPSSMRIRLEDVKTRSVQVKAQFIGKLPQPLRLETVWVEPRFVVLQGPESRLTKVREVLTEPIDLSSITENTKISVGVDVNFPQIRLAPNQPSHVAVEIKIEKGS
ncbi:MAG: diadenylate cyclase CdaA [Deltaproteobacteria bacterium]|nr:diadenylate cyclase CdaA [Deltaproteobacteria bacterium]